MYLTLTTLEIILKNSCFEVLFNREVVGIYEAAQTNQHKNILDSPLWTAREPETVDYQ